MTGYKNENNDSKTDQQLNKNIPTLLKTCRHLVKAQWELFMPGRDFSVEQAANISD
ncbi:hypothetical protein SOASR029_04530 [Budvicia aquatica]|nr:hypothetical protein SOASR029_04530 [Budvicia aquatica]